MRPSTSNEDMSSNVTDPSEIMASRNPEGGEKARQADSPPLPSIPDGGTAAWAQVFASFLFAFNTWGMSLTFGAFQTFYTNLPTPLGSPSQVSWIGSIQSFLLLFLGIFTGPIFDNGHGRLLALVGSVLCFLGLFLSSFAGLEYWKILLSQGVFAGFGMGLTFVPAITVPATYFSKHRALAIGVAMSGSGAGGIAYPPLARHLLASLGFGWTMRVLSFMIGAMLAVACFLIQPRKDLLPPSDRRRKLSQAFNLTSVITIPFAVLVLGMFLAFLGLYAPFFYIESLTVDINMNLHRLPGAWLVSLLNVGGIFGRVIPGLLADKVGPIWVHSACAIISGILMFVWPTAISLPTVILFALAYGFFSGSVITLPPTSVGSLSKDLGKLGQRLGLVFTINSFAFLSGAPLAGAILERCFRLRPGSNGVLWAYQIVAVASGLFTTVGGVVICVAGILHRMRGE